MVARGNAKAVRDTVTVDADRLLARYRPQGNRPAPPPAATPGAAPEATLGGNSEIWRLEAEGRVTIATPTDTARGDRAVYDIDQAVLVLTGREISLATQQQQTGTDQLAAAMGDILRVTEQNAAATKQMAAANSDLSTLARDLKRVVERFHVGAGEES